MARWRRRGGTGENDGTAGAESSVAERKASGSSAPETAAAETADAETAGSETVLEEATTGRRRKREKRATGEKQEKRDNGEKREKKGWTGTRLVALVAGVAVVSLLAGVVVMRFIVSPAELAARTAPPEAGPVTAAVEERVIENTVVTRGEVTYADAVDAEIDASGMTERAVVTGRVPDAGAVLNAGDIALELAGRPVLVLPGELPAYRELRVGLRGPDVVQLKAALASFGFWAGAPESDVYDADTAAAVAALYERAGYEAPTGGDEAQDALRSGERAVRDAQVSLAQAQSALATAQAANAPDVSAEVAQVNAANDALVDAQEMLGEAQIAVMPTMPASEVLYLTALPRRVDDVRVKRGDVLSGTAMQVSGATLAVTGTIGKQDAELLSEGQTAYFPGPDGEELEAKVKRIDAPKKSSGDAGKGEGEEGGSQGSGDRYTVTFEPQDLGKEQIDALRDTNVRLRIPVESTEGAVLAVPIAALTAGSGGENRVELLLDEKKDGEDTETVIVEAGLAADGYVEITSNDKRIKAGAKVVVGR